MTNHVMTNLSVEKLLKMVKKIKVNKFLITCHNCRRITYCMVLEVPCINLPISKCWLWLNIKIIWRKRKNFVMVSIWDIDCLLLLDLEYNNRMSKDPARLRTAVYHHIWNWIAQWCFWWVAVTYVLSRLIASSFCSTKILRTWPVVPRGRIMLITLVSFVARR